MRTARPNSVVYLHRRSVQPEREMIDALINGARMMQNDEFSICLAIQYEISEGIERHGIWILQVQGDRRVGCSVGRGCGTKQHRANTHGAASEFGTNNGRSGVRVVGWIRRADKHVLASARERDPSAYLWTRRACLKIVNSL